MQRQDLPSLDRAEPQDLQENLFLQGQRLVIPGAGIETDLNENVLRDVCLPHGLVDNKVCAVDDDWSGLRFVWRLENR